MKQTWPALSLVAVLLWACSEEEYPSEPPAIHSEQKTKREPEPARSPEKTISFETLMNATDEELAEIDIAEMNLACAEGLPGAEDLDIPAHLGTLDKWARAIRKETEKYFYQFRRNPSEYNNSLAYYKALMMVTVLQQDFGLMYNMQLVNSGIMADYKSSRFFRDSKDVLLNGFFSAKHAGTCSSIPVLVVSVGRRLGYPLKLVGSMWHLYARWDGEAEVFNVEAAGRGLSVHTDEHYREWPMPTPLDLIESEGYFRSMSPKEELATFLRIRGYVLIEHGRYKEALKVAEKMSKLLPESARAQQFIRHIMMKMGQQQARNNEIKNVIPSGPARKPKRATQDYDSWRRALEQKIDNEIMQNQMRRQQQWPKPQY